MFNEPRFWVSVAFVLFFVIFGYKLWSVIAAALDGRADSIRDQLAEAARLRREAEQMLEDATRERDSAQVEAQALIAASEAEATALKEQAARDASEATARHEKLTRERIEIAEQAALREIREKVAYLAVETAREVITRKLADDPQLARQLVEQGLDRFPTSLRPDAA